MLVHLDGSIVPAHEARISPFDRGFVFGDGIFEGLRAARIGKSRRVIGLSRHIRRMQAGLKVAGIDYDPARLGDLTTNLLNANELDEAFIYWQITRGTPNLEKDPVRSRIPPAGLRPTVFGYCSPLPTLSALTGPATKTAAIRLDSRWANGHIKSISLLGNVMEAIAAGADGAEEAILVRPQSETALVTEGTYTNVLIATPRRFRAANLPAPFDEFDVATPSLTSAPLLAGVTREILLDIEKNIREHAIEYRALYEASEIMLLGTTTMVSSVSHLDGRPINGGKPGPVARYLFKSLISALNSGIDEIGRQRVVRERVSHETASAL